MKGLEEVVENLGEEVQKLKGTTMSGLLAAGLILQRQSQVNLKPSVITGNLRGSGFTMKAPLTPLAVQVGFGAVYAVSVHENMQGRSPKYMQEAIVSERKKMLDAIVARAKF